MEQIRAEARASVEAGTPLGGRRRARDAWRRCSPMSLLQDAKNWVRSRSIHVAYVDVGSCNGCDIEILACLAPRYDIEQYGIYVHNNPGG